MTIDRRTFLAGLAPSCAALPLAAKDKPRSQVLEYLGVDLAKGGVQSDLADLALGQGHAIALGHTANDADHQGRIFGLSCPEQSQP